MIMRLSTTVFRLCAAVLLAAGCTAAAGGSGAAGPAADSTPGDLAAADSAADAASEVAGDTAVVADTQFDGSTDAGADSAPEAANEVGKDSAAELPPEVTGEIASETVADIGKPDAPPADAPPPDAPPTDAKPADTTANPFADPNSCGAEQACKNGQMCIAPGQSIGCGMCMKVENACEANSACEKDYVCKPQKCACGGESTCQPGCTVAGSEKCPLGTFCAPTGACVADVCLVVNPPGADKNCPANFVCENPGNPKCQRKKCQNSAECAGACVGGLCYDKAGFCSYPPP